MDQAKLDAFLGKVVGDLGATLHSAMVVIGDQRGLYKAMAEAGPMNSAELAAKTGCAERYVREWLNSQAAGGYVEYDAASGKYTLPEEHAAALTDYDSPAYVAGGFYGILAAVKAVGAISERFANGGGLGWHEHDPWLFLGTERLFRPGYRAHLVNDWIPALDGVAAKLESGASVADVGCGHGASTIVMAKRFPKSQFVGFDFHPESIAICRQRAAEAGANNARFETAKAKEFAGSGYDLITMFDCFHDMGDPGGAAAHTLKALKPDGTLLLVEPRAEDRYEQNHHPLGRMFYSVSTLVCTPCSLSQEVGTALGAQAGEARTREIVTGAGFTRFRRAAETPFNLVYEARP
jgi:SAM-dependent methyltransferase